MSEGLIIGILSALGGGILTLTVQQLKWIHERKKKQFENRKMLIKECREYVDSPKIGQDHFSNTILYSKIKPHLSPSLIREIETHTTTIHIDISSTRNISMGTNLLDELAALEIKWHII